MKIPDYIVQNGVFENSDDNIVFKGRVDEYKDDRTGENQRSVLYGEILFPDQLKTGRISFDVEFTDVCEESRCGVIFNYSNENGIVKCHQAGLRNRMGAYTLDYFNGKNWEFLIASGQEGTIRKNQKYTVLIEITGNVLRLLINNVVVYKYSNLILSSGSSGIYVCNNADVKIKNIHLDIKKPTIFSIMKFEKDFDDLYHDVISPISEKYGYQPIRADECFTSSMIIQDIIREISEASIIIADITMDNPNVFYELGYAHALLT